MSFILLETIIFLILTSDFGCKPVQGETILPLGFFGNWHVDGIDPVVWVNNGDSMLLQCRISRFEAILKNRKNASVVWLKNNEPVSEDLIRKDGHLFISEITRGNDLEFGSAGLYRCILQYDAELKYMISAPPITLIISDLKVVSKIVGFSPPYKRGGVFRLKCEFDSEALPHEIFWTKNGKILDNNQRFVQPAYGVLQIINLQLEDSGNYKCSANNSLLNETTTSPSVNLEVYDRTENEFERLSFLYPSDGEKKIPQFRETGVGGKFTEFVINTPDVGENLPIFSNGSEEEKRVKREVIEISELEGYFYLMFECIVDGFPIPKVRWFNKSIFAKESDPWVKIELDGRIDTSGNQNLHIFSVKATDAGLYKCEATQKGLEPENEYTIEQIYELKIIRPPDELRMPQNVSKSIAQTIRLNCTSNFFYHDKEQPVDLARKLGFSIESLENLPKKTQFSDLNHPNSVQNAEKNPKSLQNVAKYSISPSKFEKFFPGPMVEWYKNGLPVKTNTRVTINELNQLVILNGRSEDTAVYQCLLANEAGYSTAWSYVSVSNSLESPSPPWGLKSTILNPTSVFLEWKPPKSGQIIKAYTVYVIEHGDSSPTRHEAVVSDTTYTFENLKPNTNYSFFVQAYTDQASNPSPEVFFETSHDIFTMNPRLLLEPLSSYELKVKWQNVGMDVSIFGYKIIWQRLYKEYYNIHEVPSSLNSYIITDLLPSKTYKVKVFPILHREFFDYESGSETQTWPWKRVTMPQADGRQPEKDSGDFLSFYPKFITEVLKAPPDVPDKFEIKLTWNRPEPEQEIVQGYVAQYRKRDGEWSSKSRLSSTSTQYYVQNLDAGLYEIKIFSFNEHHTSIPVTINVYVDEQSLGRLKTPVIDFNYEGVTPKSVTPRIEKLFLTLHSPTIAYLTWEVNPPDFKVLFYTIQQKQVPGTSIIKVFGRESPFLKKEKESFLKNAKESFLNNEKESFLKNAKESFLKNAKESFLKNEKKSSFLKNERKFSFLTNEDFSFLNNAEKSSFLNNEDESSFSSKNEAIFTPTFYRSTINSISVDGLDPLTNYEFKVRAHISEAEAGPYSTGVNTIPLSRLPLAPVQITYKAVDASTLELHWSQQKGSNIATLYHTIFTRNRTLSHNNWEWLDTNATHIRIENLISNVIYYFRIRGCLMNRCGTFSSISAAMIPVVLSGESFKSHLPGVIGLCVVALIFPILVMLAIYICRAKVSVTMFRPFFRSQNPDLPIREKTSSGEGPDDYIPMLNRVPLDNSTSLDAKENDCNSPNGSAFSRMINNDSISFQSNDPSILCSKIELVKLSSGQVNPSTSDLGQSILESVQLDSTNASASNQNDSAASSCNFKGFSPKSVRRKEDKTGNWEEKIPLTDEQNSNSIKIIRNGGHKISRDNYQNIPDVASNA